MGFGAGEGIRILDSLQLTQVIQQILIKLYCNCIALLLLFFMKLFSNLIVIFFFFCFINNSYASDNLEKFLLQFTDINNYPYELLSDEYRAHYRIAGIEGPIIFNKIELKNFYEEQNSLITDYEITNFRVVDHSESDNFISATYEYEWFMELGNTNMNGKIYGHTMIEKTNNGWFVIFDAVNQ